MCAATATGTGIRRRGTRCHRNAATAAEIPQAQPELRKAQTVTWETLITAKDHRRTKSQDAADTAGTAEASRSAAAAAFNRTDAFNSAIAARTTGTIPAHTGCATRTDGHKPPRKLVH